MRSTTGYHLVVLVGLGAGWALGLAIQREIIETTGYADVTPDLLLLAIALCALAGAASFPLLPAHRRIRTGALAGVVMEAAIIGGYLVLALVMMGSESFSGGDETWFTLLLEAWFWIGIPTVVAASAGAVGWIAAARIEQVRFGNGRHPFAS